ncbi:MAG: cation:proton antiporter [Treponema sp.]|jgi:Kef-type K+ transport system membrane component KefB/mannitol/fructose-specific phosphotransferase system IIA component (Ntr-type)|nr:cation:proton antiporter [Treponema sp.]
MNESRQVAEMTALLAFQLGIILFTVRLCGRLIKQLKIPQVLGELLAGIIIGPYALGGMRFPGFPEGIFPLAAGSLGVSTELYAIASIASVILLFTSGLEADISLFFRYSLAGGIVAIGGGVVSFILGDLAGVFLLPGSSFTSPVRLFLGILSTATSAGITARILSDQKKIDSPEGVTILAAAVFDDVLGIIALAVIFVVLALPGSVRGSPAPLVVLAVAGKAFGIWLGFTALGLLFSRRIAGFLKSFKHSYDFSILALGIALVLAGIFEKQGLAMILGAYTAGLSLSKTGIAAVVRGRIRGLYEFFVPVLFALIGMMVNPGEIFSAPVLIFGAAYTAAAILAKVIGCGGPALLLGFNGRGALRIGTGMVTRGEITLIIAGAGLASGILNRQIFGAAVLMTAITALAAPPLLSAALRLRGGGTRKPVKDNDSVTAVWELYSPEIADLVVDSLLKGLKNEGFYVQTLNLDEGLSQARKDDIALSITEEESKVSIETAKTDMPFVKTAVYEVILGLHEAIKKLKDSSDPRQMKKELMDKNSRAGEDLLSLITPAVVSLNLKGGTKEEIITEMVDILASQGRLLDRDLTLKNVLEREKIMSTGLQHGIALPHAKTDGASGLEAAVGIKKEGVDFESADGEKSRIFILVVSPRRGSGPHIQFLADIGTVLKNSVLREQVINAASKEELVSLLQKGSDRSR